jgi:hypothetical protein
MNIPTAAVTSRLALSRTVKVTTCAVMSVLITFLTASVIGHATAASALGLHAQSLAAAMVAR